MRTYLMYLLIFVPKLLCGQSNSFIEENIMGYGWLSDNPSITNHLLIKSNILSDYFKTHNIQKVKVYKPKYDYNSIEDTMGLNFIPGDWFLFKTVYFNKRGQLTEFEYKGASEKFKWHKGQLKKVTSQTKKIKIKYDNTQIEILAKRKDHDSREFTKQVWTIDSLENITKQDIIEWNGDTTTWDVKLRYDNNCNIIKREIDLEGKPYYTYITYKDSTVFIDFDYTGLGEKRIETHYLYSNNKIFKTKYQIYDKPYPDVVLIFNYEYNEDENLTTKYYINDNKKEEIEFIKSYNSDGLLVQEIHPIFLIYEAYSRHYEWSYYDK